MAGSDPNGLMVEIDNLTKAFGHFKALKGVDLRIKKGDFLTIFGPNGAGKTTLIKILSTLIKGTTGEVRIGGKNIDGDGERVRAMVGLVSHQPYLYENLSALENIVFFGRMYGVRNLRERAAALIAEVGLERRMNDIVRNFSRGMQQRLSIARALVHEPELLFLDEPFTGLDQHAAKILQGYMSRFHKEGRTSIMTTHNLSEGLEMSNRVIILANGAVAYEESVANLDLEKFKKVYFKYVGDD